MEMDEMDGRDLRGDKISDWESAGEGIAALRGPPNWQSLCCLCELM